MTNRKNRIWKLKLKLKKRGLRLRKDSALCSLYINGKTDLDLNYIVQRMCEMKYLYEYCDMENIKTQVYYDYVFNEYVKNYEGTISTQAEKIALDKHSNGVYPNIFPWETSKLNEINKPNETIIPDDDEELDGGGINIFKIIRATIISYLFIFGLATILSKLN